MRNFEDVIVSLAMYDVEPTGVTNPLGDPVPPVTPVVPPVTPTDPSGELKVFSQEDVNRFMAEDRRKMIQKHEAKQTELEGAYKEAFLKDHQGHYYPPSC